MDTAKVARELVRLAKSLTPRTAMRKSHDELLEEAVKVGEQARMLSASMLYLAQDLRDNGLTKAAKIAMKLKRDASSLNNNFSDVLIAIAQETSPQ